MSIDLAMHLALKSHEGQRYGDRPYSCHLEQVVSSVSVGTNDERLVQVAWLHDILEDTNVHADTVYHLFEDNVVAAVHAMTRLKDETKEEYLHKCKSNPMARIVKIHDSLCNLTESVKRYDQKRIKKYSEQIAFLAE